MERRRERRPPTYPKRSISSVSCVMYCNVNCSYRTATLPFASGLAFRYTTLQDSFLFASPACCYQSISFSGVELISSPSQSCRFDFGSRCRLELTSGVRAIWIVFVNLHTLIVEWWHSSDGNVMALGGTAYNRVSIEMRLHMQAPRRRGMGCTYRPIALVELCLLPFLFSDI